MTIYKPSAGARKATRRIETLLKEGPAEFNGILRSLIALVIDEETGMPGLLESAEAVMDWQQMLYNESTSSANISFRDWLGNGSVGKLYDALAKTKGEQS